MATNAYSGDRLPGETTDTFSLRVPLLGRAYIKLAVGQEAPPPKQESWESVRVELPPENLNWEFEPGEWPYRHRVDSPAIGEADVVEPSSEPTVILPPTDQPET